MTDFTKLAGIIQTIFNDEADKIAKESGFIKRERKFLGSTFAKTLVFGWIANSNSSLSELQQAGAVAGVLVTK